MAGQLAAVLGTGQTKYVAKRHDVSMNGLVREAIDKALADSGSTMDDIDAVVVEALLPVEFRQPERPGRADILFHRRADIVGKAIATAFVERDVE